MVDPADGRPQPFPTNAPTILIAILIPIFIAILIAILLPSSFGVFLVPTPRFGFYSLFWFLGALNGFKLQNASNGFLLMVPGAFERSQASKCFLLMVPGAPERLQGSKCFKMLPSNCSWAP